MTETQRQFVAVAAQAMRDHGLGWEPGDDPTLAGYLLGKLEGINNTTIEEIVGAAREASCDTCDGDGFVTYGEEEEDNCPRGHRAFDEDALFRTITIEYLTGEGKVREEFGRVEIDTGRVRCDGTDEPITRLLVIPRIAVEGAQS